MSINKYAASGSGNVFYQESHIGAKVGGLTANYRLERWNQGIKRKTSNIVYLKSVNPAGINRK
jgi:hypothetical protein